MKNNRSIRRLLAVGAVVVGTMADGGAWGQVAPAAKPSAAISGASGLPPTQATAQANDAVKPVVVSRADVSYLGGRLSIDATNASLNQILREISHKTGIKVTGGVTDERVYGHYGPATPSEILASLLDGTGSNMLLMANANGPSELILTPRLGGPTPPNPNANDASSNQTIGADPVDTSRQDTPGFGMRSRIGVGRNQDVPPPPDQADPPTAAVPDAAANAAAAAASAAQSDPASPNGTKTPQQIYEQLRQLQQQQSQQSQAPQ
jgi:hypothetical protein